MQSSIGLTHDDFKVEICIGKRGEHPIAVINSPRDEAHETRHFPFDKLALNRGSVVNWRVTTLSSEEE